MEQGFSQDSVPTFGSVDKSRVLNVKPLRCLVPIFPSPPNVPSFLPPQAGPFVCTAPTGPFPAGAAPFFPFFVSPESQRPPEQNQQTPIGVSNQPGPFGFNSPIQAAVPINSFRGALAANGDTGPSRLSSRKQTQNAAAEDDGYGDYQNQSGQLLSSFSMDVADAEETSKVGKQRGRPPKKTRSGRDVKSSSPDVELDSVVDDLLSSVNLMAFDTFQRAEGDKESVGYILMIFDLLRRRINHIEDAKDAAPGVTRRPDLRAATILMNKGIRTNIKKRIGTVPGVEVGDVFYFRMEMCLVGLHAPSMAGIDYMSLKITPEEEPVAVSIVSSGGYEDNVDDADVLIYSGQGGNTNIDQKLERGNLALEKSLHRGNEVRVIRGIKDVANTTGKVYVYDGLYKIQESWLEKGKSGRNVFKYKLVRVPGQPEAFTTWKSVQQWKEGSISRVGIILPDLTSGAENLPVSLVNDVDDEKGPAYFTYLPSPKYSKLVDSWQTATFCACKTSCVSGDPRCSCAQKNGGFLPYIVNGVLVQRKSLIHECGSSCSCPPTCRNRSSQGGLKVRLEVFKTKDRGWGLRSWDPIRAGTFICEYAGEVMDKSKLEEFGSETGDEYVFDSTRTYQPQEILPGNFNEGPKIPFPIIISAKNGGNVSRFMNHSCTPNVFWQPISREDGNECGLHISFFAIRHIPPMTELTHDYGIVETSNGEQRRKRCLCGSSKCRGYFY